ncbi:sulfurase [Aliishimia ponticola]|uniref:Sulfurase n=1 Tax=Aliishimia ponticola TaxID=2499833 RepID=A0A4V3XKJ7_9RHOB|nr:MOSC domain-containing protein [Aliishimia ponticola]THH37223.1 sulfurase [Aliishimia ponticola]
MPALIETSFTGQITWLGQVPEEGESIRAQAVSELELDFTGPVGERHGGLTRPSCSRVLNQYPKRGTEIRNVRQLSVLSAEEISLIAREVGLDELDPQLLGASMVLSGIPDFTKVPPSSRLQFASGAVLTIDMENLPCHLPAREIDSDHPGHGKPFKAAARQRRGVTAWVEHPGSVAIGDSCTLYIPGQPVWPHLDAARKGG